MKQLSSNNLGGIWCSIQLPIIEDNRIDFSSLKEEIDILTNSSVKDIYCNGTAAEFYNQSESEFDKINDLLSGIYQKKQFPFQIGASNMSPLISSERIRCAKALKLDAFQIILPDWLPLNSKEQRFFLTEIIEEAAPIPVILYYLGHDKTKLTPADIRRISEEFKQLVGIKAGGGDSDWYREIRDLASDFSVFAPGHRLATGIKEGVAKGSFSNIARIDPDATRKWYEIILDDIEEGLRIEKPILKFFDDCIFPLARAGYSDAALEKLLWSLSGRKSSGTRLRWPYIGLSNQIVEEVRKKARRILPYFF